MILERDYLQAALDEAAAIEERDFEARVLARLFEWVDAYIADKNSQGAEVTPDEFVEEWQGWRSMARREVARGVAL